MPPQDRPPDPPAVSQITVRMLIQTGRALLDLLDAGRCELCKRTDNIQVHHVRRLADLDRPGQPQPEWAQVMAKRRRKSLVICGDYHDRIHGNPAAPLTQ